MSQARRFAIVTPNYHPRTCGLGDHSMRLAQELSRRGFIAQVFASGEVEASPEAPEIEVQGTPILPPMPRARALKDAVAAFGATDVVLQYTAQAYSGLRFGSPAAPWLASSLRTAGARVTLIVHEMYIPWSLRPDKAIGAALYRIQLAATLRAADRVFVTTETRKREVRRLTTLARGIDDLRVLRVGANALPAPARTEAGSSSTLKRPRFGVFSTLAKDKRFDVVLDAFDDITREAPEAELLLLGDLGSGRTHAERTLRARAERGVAEGRIHLSGKLPLSKVAEAIASIDVYLFPQATGATTRSGTLPVALGSGLPCVAVRGKETDSIFRDGENVYFARGLTGPDFADAGRALIRDGALRARLGQGAKKLYDEHLAWPVIVDRLLDSRP